uniref:Uncharacterized protein n=1 Tax=Megaselia scalaris TaxID=36166 RepID=T1GR44_MEGSC
MYERKQGENFPRTFECGPGKSLNTILKQVNAKAHSSSFNVEAMMRISSRKQCLLISKEKRNCSNFDRAQVHCRISVTPERSPEVWGAKITKMFTKLLTLLL